MIRTALALAAVLAFIVPAQAESSSDTYTVCKSGYEWSNVTKKCVLK